MGDDEDFDLDGAMNDIAQEMSLKEGEAVPETEVQQQAEQGAEQDETGKEAAVVTRAPPKSWAKEQHEHWPTLPDPVKDYIELREKQMLDGLSQYKTHADYGRAMQQAVSAYEPLLQSQGVQPAQAVQVLLDAHARLSQGTPEEKQELLAKIANDYGIEMEWGGQNQEYTALQREINQLRQMVTEQVRAGQEAARSRIESEFSAFASDPKHPYFDEVADDIIVHLQVGADLNTAYEKAVWANPVTRQKEIARLNTENEAKIKEKAKAEVAAARKATATNVRSRDTTGTPTEPLGTMEDTMKETLKEIRARAH